MNNASQLPPCSPSDKFRKKILLPIMGGLNFEKTEEIISLQAKGNYTQLYFSDGRKMLVCKTLSALEFMIGNPLKFVRVHRSYTININRIQQYMRGKGGYVKMENGQKIDVSVSRKKYFMEALGNYFG